MTGSPDGSVLLLDTERRGLYFADAVGGASADLMQKFGRRSNQRVPVEGSKAGEAFSSGKIISSVDMQDDAGHFKDVDSQTGNISRSIVSVPLQVGGKSIGVLQVLNKAGEDGHPCAYQPHDCAVLSHLGRIAATAIHQAGLINRVTAQMGLYSREGTEDLVSRLAEPAVRENLTVMFADLRGFTQLCQSQTDPSRTQEILNDLLTMFADAVLERGGIVNKFVGDAVLGLFRDADGARRAVRCAFDMLERFDSLGRRWIETSNEDLSFLDLGIGIATGPVGLGTFGSATVRDFTAIGTTVNLAAAFEAAARNGRRVLVDNATWTAIQDIVAAYEGPTPFKLGKPGQAVAVNYRHFHLKKLKADRPVRVFVSHNHENRQLVERLITTPLTKAHIQTWYSNADIIPGQKYIQEIEAGLLKCDWVFVAVSRESVKSDWVKAEVATALRDKRFNNRIVPLRLDGTEPALIAGELGLLQGVNIPDKPDAGSWLAEFLKRRERDMAEPGVDGVRA